MTDSGTFHINPDTGRPNECPDPLNCKFGGDDFHYASKHDAEVAWKARQLERGIIAYRSVMQKQEQKEEEQTLAALRKKAQGSAKKVSWGVLRSLAVKNLSKYLVNLTGLVVSYIVVSGRWLSDDWARRLIPIIATVTLVGFSIWFGIRIYKGSRKTVRVVKKKRQARKVTR
ncbi:hypothetical protein J2X11_000647 [Aeromicrobium panaciterrae]|uniref:Uncharacterized protein n=1 Tax=Aeromicrobium panaciterrae TaxID=363861 RepID=A0ABU1UKV7_9ACTN|nr:hypothetical protein [Aeromicrobium panaciterrae]MDR7085808.1 hypothetical protein [Aeromicrobium panaciterrae]